MAKLKYDRIYRDLRQKIESGEYPVQEFLPSEFRLIEEYECSRNTVRRAIADLTAQGYVQPLHGKGVRVIYQPRPQSQYSWEKSSPSRRLPAEPSGGEHPGGAVHRAAGRRPYCRPDAL